MRLSSKPRFFVDAMLGNIAKKLRLLGFDTRYSSNIEDSDLIKNAKTSGRIIITKDEQLTQIAEKQNIPIVLISESDEVEQFFQINQKINFGKVAISGKNSRCPICNGLLESIKNDSVLEDIPKNILENIKKFWQCKGCKKIYWEGSHIKNLQKFVVKLNERL